MKSSRTWGLFINALFFFSLYIAIAWLQNDFAFTNFAYGRTNGLSMAWIAGPEFQSFIWKILFLFPATILCAVALTRANVHFAVPSKISPRLSIGILLSIAAIVLIVSTQVLFHETETTDDENAYDFQAKTLLAGRFVNPPPPVINNFSNVFLINDGQHWIGKYTLGHPAVIALGMVLGNRYIVIVVLSILTLLLVYLIAKELYGDKHLALVALSLGVLSPFFYFVSSSRLSHTTTAFFLAIFMYLFLRARRAELFRWKSFIFLVAGLSLGYAFNTRSLTALGFSLPFLVVMAKDSWKSPLKAIALWGCLGTGFFVVLGFTLWYNALVTGNPLQFPFHYYSPYEAIGFGMNGHTPLFAIRNLIVNVFRLNASFLGFPLSLIFVFVLLFVKKDFGDWLAFGILLGIVGLYLLYYSPGVSDLGPVYYYETLIPLLLLSVRGFFILKEFCAKHFNRGEQLARAFLICSCIIAIVTFVPERIRHIVRLTGQIREPYETVQMSGVHHALVMIQPFEHRGWVFGTRNSSPLFTDDIVYCQYADMVSNHLVVDYFHDRSPFILRQDVKRNHFELLPVDRNHW